MVQSLEAHWGSYAAIDVSLAIVKSAATLAEQHALRTYDAIHLASALALQAELQSPVTFCAADRQLNRAAQRTALSVTPV